MAIVQISQITNRKGLQIDLPQLAGAELGWSTDTRQLYIGNGTLEEGAPVIGNTEILTEFSDIINVASAYTYKGLAAGYTAQTGPTISSPVVQSLQSWLDQYASVKDFGATGDGITDDTAAINRALQQLYCYPSEAANINPQARRSLFFPAGVYKVSGEILIPSYADLIGEGPNSSVITLIGSVTTPATCVARTTDSLQQTGAQIGSNGAGEPQWITITNLGFQSNINKTGLSVFLLEAAQRCRFTNCSFLGNLGTGALNSPTSQVSGIKTSAPSSTLGVYDIVVTGCYFNGTTYGINHGALSQGFTVSNSSFFLHYQGVYLSTGVGGAYNIPTGFRLGSNQFDSIYAEGVYFDSGVSLCGTANNIFYDVGNWFNGAGSPQQSMLFFSSSNNVSFGDLFNRTELLQQTFPCVVLNDNRSISTTNGLELSLGTYNIITGTSFPEGSVNSTIASLATVTLVTINPAQVEGFILNYKARKLSGATRVGSITVICPNGGPNPPATCDDYTEYVPPTETSTDFTFNVVQGAGPDFLVTVSVVNGANTMTLNYSIEYFDVTA